MRQLSADHFAGSALPETGIVGARERGEFLASMTAEGMGPCLAVVRSTTREVFEAYIQQVLAPALRRGQVAVMDNLTAHKGERIRELIERRGCMLVYLPPYSPDLNPLDEAFSKIKGTLRKAEVRTREVLVEVMGAAISAISTRDATVAF